MEIIESERTRQARERLIESLKTASPETRKAFKEALAETRKHFEKPEVIQEMTSTIDKMKDALESGKFKEIAEQFKEKHGLSNNAKLTEDMRRKLADELADGILGKN